MRRYDDPVEVRKGGDGPEQFLWRGRLWKVRAVLAHWVETGPWWQGSISGGPSDGTEQTTEMVGADLLAERELWRVEAGRGLAVAGSEGSEGGEAGDGGGVFDLSFDWSDGRWQLVGCED